jgi:hypothetical protein
LASEKREEPSDQRESDDQSGPPEELIVHRRVVRNSPLEGVDRFTEKQWLDDGEHIAANDRQQTPEEGALMAFQIWEQSEE